MIDNKSGSAGLPSSIDQQQRSIVSRLSLAGKVTVVTGGSRGIGLSLAKAVAELGSDVILLDLIEPVESTSQLSVECKVRVKFYRTDVTQKHSLEDSFSQGIKDFGHIDCCVTAAGVGMHKPFFEHTWADTQKILNVLGTFHTAQLAASYMRDQGTGGSIVFISSIAAHCAVPSQLLSIYSASKAGVKQLGKTLGVELAPFNIRVNSISPGFIYTDMTGQLAAKDPELMDVYTKTPPLGRIGTRDDLTGAVVYLLSDCSAYTTGSDLAITGGLHAGRNVDRVS